MAYDKTVAQQAGLEKLIKAFVLPENLGFGSCMAPVMFRADYADGQWDAGILQPYGSISVMPGAKVLQYAASVFEGMKAYKVNRERANLFRPDMNFARLNASAKELCMPVLPEALFFDGLYALVAACNDLVPDQSGQSLYIRPFIFGTQDGLGLARSETYSFMIIASPSADFHSGHMRVMIEREKTRVPVGTMGQAKAGGNYAASLHTSMTAKAIGFDQILWLDSATRENLEELSGMNVFFVSGDTLFTPRLSGSILAGVTRNSVIDLAPEMGLTVVEKTLGIKEVIQMISSGACSEAFACGTAAIISPISLLGEPDGKEYPLPNSSGKFTEEFRRRLLGIQQQTEKDNFGWIQEIPEEYFA